MFDQTVNFENVDADTLAIEHFEDLRQELGMSTVWSIFDGGCMKADDMLLLDRQYRVVYQFIRPDATFEELDADTRDNGNRTSMLVSTFAISGSVKDLWRAAESCIRQSGTHHSYIEDFVMNDDGSVELITGS